MYLLERLKLGEESIQVAQKFERIRWAEVDDCWDRQPQKQIIGRAAAQLSRIEVGKSCKVRFVEENGIEPVNTTCMSGEIVRNHAKITWVGESYAFRR